MILMQVLKHNLCLIDHRFFFFCGKRNLVILALYFSLQVYQEGL